MAATKKLRYSISDEQHAADWETEADVDYDDAPQADYEAGSDPDYDNFADPDYEEAGQPDYELGADPDYGDESADWPEPVGTEPVAEHEPAALSDGFAFATGRLVLPLAQQQAHLVLWRGQL